MGSAQDVPCYSAALYGLVSKTHESVYLQCMRAVHVAQTIAGPPNLLQLSHTFVARLCRISRLRMTVSTTKLIKRVLQEPVATSGLQGLFLCKQLLGSHDLRVALDLQIPWPPMFLQQKALEIDSRNLIFAWVQERMFHAILLLCMALCQRRKKVYICSA